MRAKFVSKLSYQLESIVIGLTKKPKRGLKDGESLPVLDGRLELVSAPDLPFDPREPLNLRVRGYIFSSRSIAGWATAE
jgi:hypothetical protein